MNQLDDATRRALCAADQPPGGAEERILAALLVPGGPAPAEPSGLEASGGGAGSGAGAGASKLLYALKVVGATLALTAGGMVGVGLVAAGVRGEGASRQRDVGVEGVAGAEVRTNTAPASAAPESATKPELPAPSGAPLARGAELVAPAASADSVGPRAPTPVAKSPPGGAPTIEAELALMKRARAAREPEQALAALDQHEERFSTGVFAAEREVLRMESLCALGREHEAELIVARFIAAHPSHPLRSRVDPGCQL